jgi:hypothetical protein
MSTTTSRLGLAAIIASVCIPAAQVVAPLVLEWYTSNLQARTNKGIELDKHKEQVAKLVLDSYLDQEAEKQEATLAVLKVFFPEYMADTTMLKALSKTAVNAAVAEKVDEATATASKVQPSNRDIARDAENAGFVALKQGNIPSARTYFDKAKAAYPTYHNVDEIARTLKAANTGDKASEEAAIETIAAQYSWSDGGFSKQFLNSKKLRSYMSDGILREPKAGLTIRTEAQPQVPDKWRAHITSKDSLYTSDLTPYAVADAPWDMKNKEAFWVKYGGQWFRFYIERATDGAGKFESWSLSLKPVGRYGVN